MDFPHTGPSTLKLRSSLCIAAWFGITCGLTEGVGLLFFQRINWERWGPMVHVAREILWISPVVDLIFFVFVALLLWVMSRLVPRFPALTVTVFVMAFLAVYDWLTLTARLYHRACFLLALGIAAAFIRWFGTHKNAALAFSRKTLPVTIALLLLVFLGIQGGSWLRERSTVSKLPPAAPGSPNVLVIVVDTLRADHLSLHGYSRPTSPTLDRLAEQGVSFQNAYSTSSWSLPSHVSLLTGKYQFEHGIGTIHPEPWSGWGNAGVGGYPTIGEALQERGYRTGGFSANHTYFNRGVGLDRGFVHFEDYFHSPADMFIRTLYGREFARLYLNRSDKSKVTRAIRFLGIEPLLDKDSEGSTANGGAQAVRKRGSVINEQALRWIDRDRQHPFFVFINYFDVHSPYGVPRSYAKPAWYHGGSIDDYDAGVKYTDDHIESLMTALQRRGLLEKTLVIITADHGESLGQHGLTYHSQALYRELIHVPLVIWYPGHVAANVRVNTPVTNSAIPATIMDLVNGQNSFPGPSLTVLWKATQAATNWPDPLTELAQTDVIDKEDLAMRKQVPIAIDGSMKSLMTSQWHLIVHEKYGAQLYDWVNDPQELHDLSGTPAGQNAAKALQSQLQQITSQRR